MRYKIGFSLSEVLLAICVFAIGMLFVAGVFPAGVLFTTIATERTIAAVVADEAFAKIRIYGLDLASLSPDSQTVFQHTDSDIFLYPSTDISTEKKYSWSALLRRTGPLTVQITVFVSRKIGTGTKYKNPFGGIADRPMPFLVEVSQASESELKILGDKTLINDGYTIIDDETGRLYRVLERYPEPGDIIKLDNSWQPGEVADYIWVIPPPISSGRCPCIAVYQACYSFPLP